MKKHLKNVGIATMLGATLFTVSCKKELGNDGSGNYDHAVSAGFTNPTQNIPVNADGVIQDNFDGNATDNIINLTSNRVWLIDGVSYVPTGKTLNIPAGTILSAGLDKTYTGVENGVSVTKAIHGVLVVVKGAKINAIGTEALPIVFTSPKAPGSRAAGDFGGIILLGDAPTNQPTSTVIEGLPVPPTAVDITYGGTDAADDSGTLQYVRIEYPGFTLFANNEINGLTLGGVGSQTDLHYVQVTYSADDSFEFFGGTVGADHLVAAGGDDDDFDFDFGYTGTIEYAVGLKALNSTHSVSSGVSDANGIESDNDKTGTGGTPRTLAILKNFTILGTNSQAFTTPGGTVAILKNAARFRRNSGFDLQNSVLGGFPTGVTTENGATGTFSSNVLHAFSTTGAYAPISTVDPANGYLLFGTTGSPFFVDHSTAFNVNTLIPRSTSPIPAATGAVAKGTASGSTWLKNWTVFTTQTKVY